MASANKNRPASKLRLAARSLVEHLEARAYLTIAFNEPVSSTIATPTGVYQKPIVADFNNDGKIDVILADASLTLDGEGVIYFAAGNGDGTFGAVSPVGGAVFVSDLAVGDFNGDGNLDLVASDPAGGEINVFTGNGDGTFNDPEDFSTPDGPYFMTVGRFNADNIDDLIVGNRGAGNISFFPGNASTIFGPNLQTATGDDPSSFATADFNGDGKLDVLVGNFGTPNITGLPGNGDGSFGTATIIGGPAVVQGAADFNGDGELDLFHGTTTEIVPIVSLGNGDLTFQAGASVGSTTNAAVIADVDGDGKVDIVNVTGNSNATLTIVPGNGDGTFASSIFVPMLPSLTGTAADINGDGLPDLVYNGVSGGQPVLATALANPLVADLVVDVISGPDYSSPVVGGSAGIVRVRVTNNGDAAFKAPALLQLLASADATPDSGDAVLVSQTPNLNLRPGKSKVFKLKYEHPLGIADGTYKLLAQIDGDAQADQSPRTNDVDEFDDFTLAAPFVDLSAAQGAPLSAAYKVGKKGKVSVTLTNLGNVPARGSLAFTFTSSADGTLDGGDTVVGTTNVKVNLKPAASRTLKVTLAIPGTFDGGTSQLFVSFAGVDITDTNAADNQFLAAEPFVAQAAAT